MRSADDIKKQVERLEFKAGAKMRKRVLDDVLKAQEKSKTTSPAHSVSEIWRIIMTSRITKYAVAAVVMIAIASITIFDRGVAPAYGLTEAINKFKNASTVHISGWTFYPSGNKSTQEYVKIPLEFWFDLETGCYNMKKPCGLDKNGKGMYSTIISDGEYLMGEINHIPSDGDAYKTVRFEKLTAFQSMFAAHNSAYTFLMQTFGGADRIDGFKLVGTETIKGADYGMWEGKIATPGPNGGMQAKIKSWISLDTGELGRIKMSFMKPGEESWMPVCDIDKIELNVELPEGIFITEPPAGYKLDNSKETAPYAELGTTNSITNNGLSLSVHAAFSLPDGSVIVCWRSSEKRGDRQDEMFEGLKFGGEIPKLPLEIRSLISMPDSGGEYMGYHLAHTKKKNKSYEWSIYVAGKDAPTRDSIIGYEAVHRYNTKKKKRPVLITMSISEDIMISTADDFDMWVLGAMEELNDSVELPEITYEGVLKLADDIRNTSD